MEKSIYDLKLHECVTMPWGITIMRVPGGWIYDAWNPDTDCFKLGMFIPYSNEFQNSGINEPCIFESDNTTPENCKKCGNPKWIHDKFS